MSTMDKLELQLSNALSEMLERGFELPFYFAVVAVNGAMLAGRYVRLGEEEIGCELLSQYCEDEAGFQVPVNIMIVDSNGEAVRVLLQKNQPMLIQ